MDLQSLNLTKDQFLDLDEILVGALPKNVVVDSLTNARGSVRQGLRGGKFNVAPTQRAEFRDHVKFTLISLSISYSS